jgi:hypothetical protein
MHSTSRVPAVRCGGRCDVTTTGDRDREPNHRSEVFVELTTAPVRPLAPAPNVYDDIRRTLIEHGWARGREHGRNGALGLVGAVETVVRRVEVVDAALAPAAGPRLAREARIGRHLRELAGTSNLGAWNDAAGRSLDDVLELLTLAATAYPED